MTQDIERTDTFRWPQLFSSVDLLFTLFLAIPGLSHLMVELFFWLHDSLGLPGHFPAIATGHMMLINILGVMAVLWAVVIVARSTPFVVLVDSLGRLYIALLILGYLISAGISAIFWAFVVLQLAIAISQLVGLARARSSLPASPAALTSTTALAGQSPSRGRP